ncbi:MAG: type II toxin-antitoxin system HigB family toxin [Pseudomonadota bacterium]
MRVISNTVLVRFASAHGSANAPLQAWRKILEAGNFADFSALKKAFNSVDKVGKFYVFNLGGNKFRIVTAIHFNTQHVYIRFVFTHQEYDKWKP